MGLNKAKEVRDVLGLTQREAGELFARQEGQNASDTWGRWERTGNWPKPAEALFIAILTLKMAEDLKTRNCHGALRLVLEMLQPDDEHEGT